MEMSLKPQQWYRLLTKITLVLALPKLLLSLCHGVLHKHLLAVLFLKLANESRVPIISSSKEVSSLHTLREQRENMMRNKFDLQRRSGKQKRIAMTYQSSEATPRSLQQRIKALDLHPSEAVARLSASK